MMDLTACERKCELLGGADCPIAYCLDGDTLPGDLQMPGCAGLTSMSYDLALYPFLKDRWRGRGFACVIWPSRCWREPLREDILLGLCHNVAYHEFCHRLDAMGTAKRLMRWMRPETVAEVKAEAARFESISETARGELLTTMNAYSEPWSGHEKNFIRAAVNLAARGGLALGNLTIAGPDYSLSDVGEYRDALWPEQRDRAGDLISEILADDPPPAFEALFEADRLRWYQQQTQKKETTNAA